LSKLEEFNKIIDQVKILYPASMPLTILVECIFWMILALCYVLYKNEMISSTELKHIFNYEHINNKMNP
jgi:hypothetical protein